MQLWKPLRTRIAKAESPRPNPEPGAYFQPVEASIEESGCTLSRTSVPVPNVLPLSGLYSSFRLVMMVAANMARSSFSTPVLQCCARHCLGGSGHIYPNWKRLDPSEVFFCDLVEGCCVLRRMGDASFP